MQDDDKKYSTDWEQFPPIEGDYEDPLAGPRMLVYSAAAGLLFWAVILFIFFG